MGDWQLPEIRVSAGTGPVHPVLCLQYKYSGSLNRRTTVPKRSKPFYKPTAIEAPYYVLLGRILSPFY